MNKAQRLHELTGLSIVRLAALMGVSRQAYYLWMQGKRTMRPKHRTLLNTYYDAAIKTAWEKHLASSPWEYSHHCDA